MKHLQKYLLLICLIFSGIPLSAENNFGLGFMLGSPMDIMAKYKFSDTHAVEAGIGDTESYNLYIYGDYILSIYKFSALSGLSLFVGAGAGYNDYRHDRHNNNVDENRFEGRIPFGLEYIFRQVPVSVFAEIIPALEVAPAVNFRLRGGFGARYYF